MTSSGPATEPAAAKRRRVLDPTERSSEVLFGLIMVLTFTGSLSAASSGRNEIRTMLIGAVGCNLAWGIVDAIMYLLNTWTQRGLGLTVLRRVRAADNAKDARDLIADEMPPVVASALRPEDFEAIRQRLAAISELPVRAPLKSDDFRGALAVFLLVFLSTFPVVIPFLVMSNAMRALRASNAIAIALLFIGGYKLGGSAGYRPWRTGFAMVGIGMALVAITIALGG